MKNSTCYECGNPMQIDDVEVSNHLTADGAIDYDQDADHVAVDEDRVETIF